MSSPVPGFAVPPRPDDPRHCPVCAAPVPAPPVCARCGAWVLGPAAEELAGIAAEQAALAARRARLVEHLRAEGAAALRARGVPGPVPQQRQPAGAQPLTVQRILLGLGVAALGVAALTFVYVTWDVLGLAGRAAVLLSATVASAVAGRWSGRRLPASGTALAVLTCLLAVVDVVGARQYGLLPADAVPDTTLLAACLLAAVPSGLALERWHPCGVYGRVAAAAACVAGPATAAAVAADLLDGTTGGDVLPLLLAASAAATAAGARAFPARPRAVVTAAAAVHLGAGAGAALLTGIVADAPGTTLLWAAAGLVGAAAATVVVTRLAARPLPWAPPVLLVAAVVAALQAGPLVLLAGAGVLAGVLAGVVAAAGVRASRGRVVVTGCTELAALALAAALSRLPTGRVHLPAPSPQAGAWAMLSLVLALAVALAAVAVAVPVVRAAASVAAALLAVAAADLLLPALLTAAGPGTGVLADPVVTLGALTGRGTLAVTAVVLAVLLGLLALPALLPAPGPREPAVVAVAAAVPTGLLLTAGGHQASGALVGGAVGLATLAAAALRRADVAAFAGAAVASAGGWLLADLLHARTLEAYSLPAAALLAVAAAVRERRVPGGPTWLSVGPAAAVALWPSAGAAVQLQDQTLRAALVAAAGTAMVLAALRLRWAAPLHAGAGALALLVLHQLSVVLADLPPLTTFTVTGAALVAAGVRYEALRRSAHRARVAVAALR